MSDKKKPERPDLVYAHPLLDFPDGSGEPDCPKCKGRGVVPRMVDIGGGVMYPGGGVEDCLCVFKRDLLLNVKRVWKVLVNVESVDESPLLKMTKQSLWITASGYDFRQHMRYVAFRMGPKWDARVIADATLMTAWLARLSEVYDTDVRIAREGHMRERPSEHYLTLVDLAVPFDLLIIVLGVKAAANKEMANVLIEALHEREMAGKPTWIVDSWANPVTGPTHKCNSPGVLELLEGFRRIKIAAKEAEVVGAAAKYPASRQAAPRTPVASSEMEVTNYTKRKGGMGQRTPGTPTAPPAYEPDPGSPYEAMPMEDDGDRLDPVPEPDADDDEFSVDALIAAAHDPTEGQEGVILPPDGEQEVEELLEDFPDADELGGNSRELPAFLTGPLTKQERLAEEKQNRYARRGHRNRKDGE